MDNQTIIKSNEISLSIQDNRSSFEIFGFKQTDHKKLPVLTTVIAYLYFDNTMDDVSGPVMVLSCNGSVVFTLMYNHEGGTRWGQVDLSPGIVPGKNTIILTTFNARMTVNNWHCTPSIRITVNNIDVVNATYKHSDETGAGSISETYHFNF